jgi:hypothetical protein
MSKYKTLLLLTFLLGLAELGWSQNGNSARTPVQIDPSTGQFRMMTPEAEVIPNALSTVTGKFVVKFTITVSSTLPTTDVISCGVSAEVLDTSTQFILLDSATVAATRSGSTATCTVTLPYSWSLGSSTLDKALLSFTISSPATTAGTQYPNRYSQHSFASISIPATGVTTNFTLTPTI